MDGRIQETVTEWVKAEARVQFVDIITGTGVDGVLAKGTDTQVLELIRKGVNISVNVHKSSFIVVGGHHDCAGNPVSKEDHWSNIRDAVKLVLSWNFPVKRVVGLWVNDKWEVEQVC